MVVEKPDEFALPENTELLFNNIYNGHDVLPFVLFANEELVLGGHCYSAALANETNEGHLALDPSKIACTPVIVNRWIAMLGAGYEFLGRFAFQNRQPMAGVDGSLHALHCLVELFFGFEGWGPKQKAIQQTVQVLDHPVAPGLA